MKRFIQRLSSLAGYALAYFFSFPMPPTAYLSLSGLLGKDGERFAGECASPSETSAIRQESAISQAEIQSESDAFSMESRSTLCSKLYDFIAFHGKNPLKYNFHFYDCLGDWFLRSTDGVNIELNMRVARVCSEAYYGTIACHEMFHVLHGLVNVEDAKLLRSVFGESTLRAIDVEADLETWRFLNAHDGISHERFIEMLYEGQAVFRAKDMAFPGKLERFFGTALSTYAHASTGNKVVFVPQLSCIALDGKLSVLILTAEAIRFAQIDFSIERLQALYQLYQFGHNYTMQDYCTQLIGAAQVFFTQYVSI